MSTFRVKNKDGTWDKVPVLGSYQAVLAANEAATNAQNAAKEVKEIYGDGNFTPLSDLLGGLGTKLKRWGTIFANKVFASNLPIVYNSVAEMKADTMLWEGMNIKTLGYYAPNDGGGGLYIIKSETDKYAEELSNGLKAELIIENGIADIKCFGANTNDDISTLFQLAQKQVDVLLINDTYKLTESIWLECSIDGHGTINVSVNDFTLDHWFYVFDTDRDNWFIKNISLVGDADPRGYSLTNNNGYEGIRMRNAKNVLVENVKMHNIPRAICVMQRSKNVLIRGCVVTNALIAYSTENTVYPETTEKNASNIKFENCIGYGTYIFNLGTGNNIVAENCYGKVDYDNMDRIYFPTVVFLHLNDNIMPVHPVYRNCTFEVADGLIYGYPFGINENLYPETKEVISGECSVSFENCNFVYPESLPRACLFYDVTKVVFDNCKSNNGAFNFESGHITGVDNDTYVIARACDFTDSFGTLLYQTRGTLLLEDCKLKETASPPNCLIVNQANDNSYLLAKGCNVSAEYFTREISSTIPATIIGCNNVKQYAMSLDSNYLSTLGNVINS